MDGIEPIMDFLQHYSANPVLYIVIFFIYGILNVLFLPVPVELGLIWNPDLPFIIKALVLGGGKAVGALIVFTLGEQVEGKLRTWERWRWYQRLVSGLQWFVAKFRYLGLYVILSIPGMVDTVPVYLFSLFNREGEVINRECFILVNFLGGVTRAFVLYLLLFELGIDLFSPS